MLHRDTTLFKHLLCTIALLLFSAQSVQAANTTPSHYDDNHLTLIQEFLEQDERWFEIKDQIRRENIRAVAIYNETYLPDGHGENIESQVQAMIYRMLHQHDIAVRECIECNKTHVNMTDDGIRIKRGVESNEMLRDVANDISADAFLFWDVRPHLDSYDISLRLVKTQNNQVVWSDSYVYAKAEEKSRKGRWGIAVSYLGFESDVYPSLSGQHENFSNVTDFSLRYHSYRDSQKRISYGFVGHYFKSLDSRYYTVDGWGVEGRVYYGLTQSPTWLDVHAYVGVGQTFIDDSHDISFRAGFELEYSEYGYFDLGIVHFAEQSRSGINYYYSERALGDIAIDFTLGFRF